MPEYFGTEISAPVGTSVAPTGTQGTLQVFPTFGGTLSKIAETIAEGYALNLAGQNLVTSAPRTSPADTPPASVVAARQTSINPNWIIGGFAALAAVVLVVALVTRSKR